MTDVILVAAIVAFFAAAIFLVRALSRLIAESAEQDPDSEYQADDLTGRRHDLMPGRHE
jgi:hypothetical protein